MSKNLARLAFDDDASPVIERTAKVRRISEHDTTLLTSARRRNYIPSISSLDDDDAP
jgi:hypothetical protein